jgi:hypothetical protein
MKPHFERSTRNFGSFMCVRNLPRFLLDDTGEIIERGIPAEIVIESLAVGKIEPPVRKPDKHFRDIPKRIWLRLTGKAAAP